MSDNPQTTFDRHGLPRPLARFNRVVTNPIQSAWAPYLIPWAVVVHTGRRSGTHYRTPVMAFRRGDDLAIGLPYGPKTQWLLNLLAAGHGNVLRGGRLRHLDDFRIVDSRHAQLPRGARTLGRLTDRVLLARISPTDHPAVRRIE